MDKKWQFNFDKKASFTCRNRDMIVPWEFIYQNRDILVRVDQNGVNNCQAKPPCDIMLFKREWNEKFSKWMVWIKSKAVNSDKPISNFGVPVTDIGGEPPKDVNIEFSPDKATYEYTYQNIKLKTELIVPLKGAAAIMKTTVKNCSDQRYDFEITPCFMPYINQAMLAPWDKPEWYMLTHAGKEHGKLLFSTKLYNPSGDKTKRRYVTMYMDGGFTSCENSLERFAGNGDFNCPNALLSPELRIAESRIAQCRDMCGYPPVYAARYRCGLDGGEEKSFTQILKMHENKDGRDETDDCFKYFRESEWVGELKKIDAFYDGLFSKRTVKTGDRMFDYYVNYFLPLQMYWVASLDRGWPTGMRGVRDCSNDFMGMLAIDPQWSQEMLIALMQCQRSDGYFLRQISTEGKTGKHDARRYVDGGAFFLEFFYEYMCYCGDAEFFEQRVDWLDSDGQSTVLEHSIRAISFYLQAENIGEHGLIKIYEGDWLDSVNGAGLQGRGESVTVTNQIIMSLKNMCELLDFARESGVECCRERYTQLKDDYMRAAENFKESLIKHAYNDGGFFSSVFTDGGRWVFSDADEDGEKRVYGPANYYGILSGVADAAMQESIKKNIDSLKCDMGYRLFYPPLGKKEMNFVGRIASGDVMEGLWENGSVYNHGSQGFLARALAYMGEKDKLFEVIEYMLPYSEKKYGVDQTLSAPYAIVNCYQDIDCFRHRAGMPFLTGTIAMSVRAVYNWMFGIQFCLRGIEFKPCLKADFSQSNVKFEFRGCKFDVTFIRSDAPRIIFNGQEQSGNRVEISLFLKENTVIVYYS